MRVSFCTNSCCVVDKCPRAWLTVVDLCNSLYRSMANDDSKKGYCAQRPPSTCASPCPGQSLAAWRSAEPHLCHCPACSCSAPLHSALTANHLSTEEPSLLCRVYMLVSVLALLDACNNVWFCLLVCLFFCFDFVWLLVVLSLLYGLFGLTARLFPPFFVFPSALPPSLFFLAPILAAPPFLP